MTYTVNCTERLLKNYFRNIRHHLHLKIQTRIMLKTKVILTSLVIGFLAFESCHAFYGVFYRPMLSFIEKPFLQDHLERRTEEVAEEDMDKFRYKIAPVYKLIGSL